MGEAGEDAEKVGVLDVHMKSYMKRGEKRFSWETDMRYVDTKNIKEDTAIASKVKSYEDLLGKELDVKIGETLSEKKANKTLQVLEKQIDASITKVNAQTHLIVAYEPIWAIGSGLTPNGDEIRQAHMHIKEKVNQYFKGDIPILYGGSANAENCSKIISIENVDGLLVGGASLKKRDFEIICNC